MSEKWCISSNMQMLKSEIDHNKKIPVRVSIRMILLFLAFHLFITGMTCAQILLGWASLNGGTTGGKGGDTLNVYRKSELLQVLNLRQKRIIVICDTLHLDGKRIDITEGDLTILGAGKNALIQNGGFALNSDNIIVRNLSFADLYQDGHWDGKGFAGADAISVYGKNIWIDHCEFSHGFDGLLDITREADYVTVSWCKFFNHNKVMLIGSRDTDTISRGHLRTTIHHCWFDGFSTFKDTVDKKDHRLAQRMPRVRFGDVHVFNNYYEQVGDYGIAARFESDVVVENNYFRNLQDPHIVDDIGKGTDDPDLVASGNIYDNTGGDAQVNGKAFNPSSFYGYQLDPADEIPALVMNGAGILNRKSNAPPIGLYDTIQIISNETVEIRPLSNDYDADGDDLRISAILNQPSGKTVVYPKFIQYKPEKDFVGDDTIDYQFVDLEGGIGSSRIFIHVKN